MPERQERSPCPDVRSHGRERGEDGWAPAAGTPRRAAPPRAPDEVSFQSSVAERLVGLLRPLSSPGNSPGPRGLPPFVSNYLPDTRAFLPAAGLGVRKRSPGRGRPPGGGRPPIGP